MASFGKSLVIALGDRLNERREYLAEQRAQAQENLRRIEASRRESVGNAREELQRNADYLITRGFSESEISQLLDNDPREVIRLGTRLYNNDDIRIDDVRAAARFREDYAQDTPLSELIRQATPIFRDIEEPDPAVRQQNIFQRLFSMDTEADMDRFYRESNFGGFSGYDILGSVDAGDYRDPRGERLIDFNILEGAATQLTDVQKEYYLEGAEDTITSLGETLSGMEGLDPTTRRLLREAEGNSRRIVDILFDDSEENMERYEALRPYRERLLEDLAVYYEQYPTMFTDFTPTFGGRLGGIVEEYVAARGEEGATPAAIPVDGADGTPTPGVGTDLGEITEDNAQSILDQIVESDEDTFVIDGVATPREDAVRLLEDRYGAERRAVGVETEGTSSFDRDVQTITSSAEADRLITEVRTNLATGEYGPGSAPIRRFWRYLTESDQEVLDEAEAIQAATDLLNDKEDKIRQIILYNEEARRLFEEDPLRFLEEYSDQLNEE